MTTPSGNDVEAEILERAANAVCRHCSDGVPLINGEWHSIQFHNPDEMIKVYCLATPIRKLT